MQFGVEVNQNLNLLTLLVELVARSGVDGSRILLEGNIGATLLLHGSCSSHQGTDVVAGHGDGQQAYRGQYRESATHVVGDDEGLVALLVGRYASCTLLGVGHSHDYTTSLLLTTLAFTLFAQQAEGQSRLGSRTRLGDIDDTKFLILQVVGQFIQIVLADVVTCEENDRTILLFAQPGKAIAQGLNHGACAQVASADTGHYNGLAIFTQHLRRSHKVVEVFLGDRRRQVEPAQEIVAQTRTIL